MPEVIFTLQTITPLFMAGADQNAAELRAPSFRGLMRYWQRALVGGLVFDLDTVRELEAAVFGATDRASAAQIRVSQPLEKPLQFTENISKPGEMHQATGKGYLLWSMRLKNPPRYYFAPGTQFQIYLSTHDPDIINLKKSIAALWLLTHLGGIGSRSRRCAGSLTITLYKGDAYDFPFEIPTDVLSLKDQIEQGISASRSLYMTAPLPVTNATALFDTLSQNTCRIWILLHEHPWATPEEAMRVLGESLQSYRSIVPLIKRKIFGLPLRGVQGSVERRASPLLLRLVELQGNKYVGLAVLFKTHNHDTSPRDYSIIEDWVNEFRGKQEVIL